MATIIDAKDILIYSHLLIIDVRSPSEYLQGHIPNAINIPLFTNEERAIVGTIYKEQGKDAAIKTGLQLVGVKLNQYITAIQNATTDQEIIVHCWRGGKRSSSMAWLFELIGYKVYIIQGGYKSYRSTVLKYFEQFSLKLIVVGGRTGSGKTAILHELNNCGEQIIDLEALANHKGSAFGWIGESNQVTVEHFENKLFDAFCNLNQNKSIWIENESRTIGKVFIPSGLWNVMKSAKLYHIEIEHERRIQILLNNYSDNNKDELITSFKKISKKLGSEKCNKAISLINQNRLSEAALIALDYYDAFYDYDYNNNTSASKEIINCKYISNHEIAIELIRRANKS